MSQLDELKKYTVVVADTGDIDSIKQFSPQDATTNPSLVLKAAELPQYHNLIDDAVKVAKKQGGNKAIQLINATDQVAVNIGVEILKLIPGRISTEIDARLSFDAKKCVNKALKIIALYKEKGIDKSRILIKTAATWEGIQAAKQLEQLGINCNLTLLFSFAQARACAEAGVFLISPFVGRIFDWYTAKSPTAHYTAADDPGVISVREIYNYYKQHGYKTVVMGASFRNKEQILALAGCDRLTLSPALLDALTQNDEPITRRLSPSEVVTAKPDPLDEAQFRWLHNSDAMAVEKLSEGIRLFAADQKKLEDRLAKLI